MAVVTVVLGAALSVAVGVAAGALPASWHQYLWVAWPVSLALVVALGYVTVVTSPGDDSTWSRRAVRARDRARKQLLDRVDQNWIAEVLERSLYQEARLELGLSVSVEEPHPWGLVSARARGRPEPVSAGTQLTDVFDQLDHAMLILGAPGSGKTITMLELLRSLLAYARADKGKPIPVVLPLASWALSRQPMVAWIAREIGNNYHIEARHVAVWEEEESLVLLLDGLDEVTSEYREDCVRAINDFRREHYNLPIIVCCRTQDYQQFRTGLSLYGTLSVLPLTRQQVEQFLARPGDAFAGVRAALVRDPGLWGLADSPFMLSVMILAFRENGFLGSLSSGTEQGLRNRLFEKYVHVMLESHQSSDRPPASTVRMITFLARQLQRYNQTLFSVDLLDSKSLPSRWWSFASSLANWIIWKAVMVLGMSGAAMISYGWRGGLVGGLAGFLSSIDSKIRVNTYSLALNTSMEERLRVDQPQPMLEMLVQAAPDSVSEHEWPDWMSKAVLLVGSMTDRELEALRKLSGEALEQELSKRLLMQSLPSLSQNEVVRLLEFSAAELKKEVKKGALKQKLTQAELSWIESVLAGESSVAELGVDDFLTKEELQALRSDRRWRARLLLWGTQAFTGAARFRWKLEARSYYFGDIPSGGLVFVLAVAIASWIWLGGAFSAATALGGAAALIAVNAISKLIPRVPRRSLAANFPSPGLRATLRSGAPMGLAAGLLAGLMAAVFLAWTTTLHERLRFGVTVAVCGTLFAVGCLGGFAFIEQLRIRFTLSRAGLLPIRARAFLDYAAQCLFLIRSGETYIFTHRMLQEFLAAFCPPDNDPDVFLTGMLAVPDLRPDEASPRIQYYLGMLLEERMDPPDLDGARIWYSRAAKAGSTEAQEALKRLG